MPPPRCGLCGAQPPFPWAPSNNEGRLCISCYALGQLCGSIRAGARTLDPLARSYLAANIVAARVHLRGLTDWTREHGAGGAPPESP